MMNQSLEMETGIVTHQSRVRRHCVNFVDLWVFMGLRLIRFGREEDQCNIGCLLILYAESLGISLVVRRQLSWRNLGKMINSVCIRLLDWVCGKEVGRWNLFYYQQPIALSWFLRWKEVQMLIEPGERAKRNQWSSSSSEAEEVIRLEWGLLAIESQRLSWSLALWMRRARTIRSNHWGKISRWMRLKRNGNLSWWLERWINGSMMHNQKEISKMRRFLHFSR